MDSQQLYHITSLQEWQTAQKKGEYEPGGFTQDQFIHCSYCHQLLTVAHRFYKGQNGLVLLVIESSKINTKINSSLVEENLEGGEELYPHIYGLLPTDAVTKVISFPCDAEGKFTLPDEL